MIILSQALVLNPQDIKLNTPIFGYENLAATVVATTEDVDNPASNLTNPSTALRWVATDDSTDQYLTVDTSTFGDIDYVAIAIHNLGSGQNAVSVEYLDPDPSPDDWIELVEEHLLANDEPAIFRFSPQPLAAIRLRIQPSQLSSPTTPSIAVMHVGKLLVMPRGTHTDHNPINLNITSQVMNGKSETGNFLGRIVLSEGRSTSIGFNRLEANWYRTYMHPFIIAAKQDPFFFAQQPQAFPRDVGYCWLTNDPQPAIHFDTKTMAIQLQMGGVAVG